MGVGEEEAVGGEPGLAEAAGEGVCERGFGAGDDGDAKGKADFSEKAKPLYKIALEKVKDDKVSVGQHVAAVAKELGADVAVKGYIRYEKGEGIEKRQDDLAAEVAKMVKG